MPETDDKRSSKGKQDTDAESEVLLMFSPARPVLLAVTLAALSAMGFWVGQAALDRPASAFQDVGIWVSMFIALLILSPLAWLSYLTATSRELWWRPNVQRLGFRRRFLALRADLPPRAVDAAAREAAQRSRLLLSVQAGPGKSIGARHLLYLFLGIEGQQPPICVARRADWEGILSVAKTIETNACSVGGSVVSLDV